MDRKEFIKKCAINAVALSGAGILLESCSPVYYAVSVYADRKFTLAKSEFYGEKKGEVFERRFVLVESDRIGYPICVFKFSETDYSALYTECMHQGCEVRPRGEFMVCPCHGSEYTNRGKVINPPAEEDLLTFDVIVGEENIQIVVTAS